MQARHITTALAYIVMITVTKAAMTTMMKKQHQQQQLRLTQQ